MCQQSVAYQLKWPELLSKQHALPSISTILNFVLMTNQKEMEMHHNHQQKDDNIHIQKRGMLSMKMFCHNWEQLLILSTCKHLRLNVMHHWPCWIKIEIWKLPFIMIQQQGTRLMENDLVSFHAFSINGQTFRHRPMFFAFEDQKQFASLIVKMYECLAAAATIFMERLLQLLIYGTKLMLSWLMLHQKSCWKTCMLLSHHISHSL